MAVNNEIDENNIHASSTLAGSTSAPASELGHFRISVEHKQEKTHDCLPYFRPALDGIHGF